MTLEIQAGLVKKASEKLSIATTELRDKALEAIAVALERNMDFILEANAADVEVAKDKKIEGSRLDRLVLSQERITNLANSVREVVKLPDPLCDEEVKKRPNGLKITKRRVPFGVVGMIYEFRPNVTVDAAALCLKSGNAVLLRGSETAIVTNLALVKVMKEAIVSAGLPAECIELLADSSREAATTMIKLDKYIDILIPRGGAGLIKHVKENATVPIIETGVGNCHTYIDEFADLKMGVRILVNAKTGRPSVCNSCETLLVHQKVAGEFLPLMYEELVKHDVELRGCEETLKILSTKGKVNPNVVSVVEDDYYKEFNDLILAVKVVENVDAAIEHINTCGTKHSECIVTANEGNASKFLSLVDAACVYHNASTWFSDGGEFGLGAEMGISTQKLHARGPFALKELTTYKYVIQGKGQVR